MKRVWRIGIAVLLLCVMGCGSAASDGAEAMTEAAELSKVQSETLISYEGGTYMSSRDDENALCLSGGRAMLEDITVQKTGGTVKDLVDGDMYGSNAALLAKDGVDVSIAHAIVSSTAQGGSGIFCRGEGSKVTVYNSVVSTSGDYAGGLQTTEAGSMDVWNLTVKTSGETSAAIRTVYGGGSLRVSGGKYTTNGFSSPAVYSAGEIVVENAVLTANNAEALMLEGRSSLELNNCVVTGQMREAIGDSENEHVQAVRIDRSNSNVAEFGGAVFSMKGGSLTSLNGDLFCITNVPCRLFLSQVDLQCEDPDGLVLRVTGDGDEQDKEETGVDGVQVTLVAEEQELSGDVEVGEVSVLEIQLRKGSVWNGALRSAFGETDGVVGTIVVTIDENSVWSLAGDSRVSALENAGTIRFNGYTITLADGTVLREE